MDPTQASKSAQSLTSSMRSVLTPSFSHNYPCDTITHLIIHFLVLLTNYSRLVFIN